MAKLVPHVYTRKDVLKYAFDGLIDGVEMLHAKSGKPREYFLEQFKDRNSECFKFLTKHVKTYLDCMVEAMNQLEREYVENINNTQK